MIKQEQIDSHLLDLRGFGHLQWLNKLLGELGIVLGKWGYISPISLRSSAYLKSHSFDVLCFFCFFFRTLSEFFARCPKCLEPFRTKCPKKFCLLQNNTLVAAPCSLT